MRVQQGRLGARSSAARLCNPGADYPTRTAAQDQTVTPDLFSPNAEQPDLRRIHAARTAAENQRPSTNPKLRDNEKDKPAPSRIGQIPR